MLLNFPDDLWSRVHDHMDDDVERASFFFTKFFEDETWEVKDTWILDLDEDYTVATDVNLVLSDEIRQRVIRHAHVNQYAVVESHSHYWPGESTQFSSFDLQGLAEFAPHMLWRLPNRPYTSLVIGSESFDGLTWTAGNKIETLDGLIVKDKLLIPTGLSLKPFRRFMKDAK